MTNDEKMIAAVQALIKDHGIGYVVTRAELLHLLCNTYHITAGSVIPSDYCYNRVNNGITLSKPTLFEHLGRGQYRCLGEHYPYNGPVYHKNFMIGHCKEGSRPEYLRHNSNDANHHKQAWAQKSRDPSTRLRFEVLARDKFTCRFCGASPSKDPAVTLHIDHIFPWSKGGKTTLDNLQTLCSKCNLGKSDLIID